MTKHVVNRTDITRGVNSIYECNLARCKIGLKKIVVKLRKCLECGREFRSVGIGNRLCKYCRITHGLGVVN